MSRLAALDEEWNVTFSVNFVYSLLGLAYLGEDNTAEFTDEIEAPLIPADASCEDAAESIVFRIDGVSEFPSLLIVTDLTFAEGLS